MELSRFLMVSPSFKLFLVCVSHLCFQVVGWVASFLHSRLETVASEWDFWWIFGGVGSHVFKTFQTFWGSLGFQPSKWKTAFVLKSVSCAAFGFRRSFKCFWQFHVRNAIRNFKTQLNSFGFWSFSDSDLHEFHAWRSLGFCLKSMQCALSPHSPHGSHSPHAQSLFIF